MEKLTAAFCDDDPAFRAVLRRTAEAAFQSRGVALEGLEVSTGAELSALSCLGGLELIFLDIDLPGEDGIRIGETLRARGSRADIIYVSNLDEKVFEIFHVHPWSFVRKSRLGEELPGVVAEYVRARQGRTAAMLLPGPEGETVSVDPAALVYVEAVGKTQRLTAATGETVMLRTSLRELELRLEPHGFIRIHKGFLVNYRYIKKITSRGVLLDTGDDLPVGRDRLGPARERYLSLMKWKGLGG